MHLSKIRYLMKSYQWRLHKKICGLIPSCHTCRIPDQRLLTNLFPPVALSLMCRAVMPSSLHLWATSWAASIAAYGEDSSLSAFTFMPPVTRQIVSLWIKVDGHTISKIKDLTPMAITAKSESKQAHVHYFSMTWINLWSLKTVSFTCVLTCQRGQSHARRCRWRMRRCGKHRKHSRLRRPGDPGW